MCYTCSNGSMPLLLPGLHRRDRRYSPLLDFLAGDSGVGEGYLLLLKKLRPESDRSVQHGLPRVVDLGAVLVLCLDAAAAAAAATAAHFFPAALPARVPRPGGGQLYGVVVRDGEKGVDVLHEDVHTLDLFLVEGRRLSAEVVAEADHPAAGAWPAADAGPVRVRVGAEEAAAAVAGDALPPLGPAPLLERVLALDVLVAAAGARLLAVAPGLS